MTGSNSKGGKLSEILAELKSEYQANFPKKVSLIRSLCQRQEWGDLAEEFHKLKGTGKTYGFPEVSQICESLEFYCRGGEVDLESVERVFPVFARMQECWGKGQNFDPTTDEEAVFLMSLRGRRS